MLGTLFPIVKRFNISEMTIPFREKRTAITWLARRDHAE